MGGHLGGAAGPSGGRASAGTSTTSGACAVDGGAAASGTSGAAKEPADNLELGELEQLTITNDNESSYDVRKKTTRLCISSALITYTNS